MKGDDEQDARVVRAEFGAELVLIWVYLRTPERLAVQIAYDAGLACRRLVAHDMRAWLAPLIVQYDDGTTCLALFVR